MINEMNELDEYELSLHSSEHNLQQNQFVNNQEIQNRDLDYMQQNNQNEVDINIEKNGSGGQP